MKNKSTKSQGKFLLYLLELLDDSNFIAPFKIGKNSFTRKRKLTFSSCFLFLCSIPNRRLQSELDTFFNPLNNTSQSLRVVTSSAFSQCRDKIDYKAFKVASTKLVDFFYKNSSIKKYHGMRLIAIDGTVLTLPRNNETIAVFGDNVLSQCRTWIKAQVSFASDVLNTICIDAYIGAYLQDERSQAMEHFNAFTTNDLLLFDRGYFSRDFLAKVYQKGVDFCFRVSVNACSEVIDFIKSDVNDRITNVQCEGQNIKVRISKITLSDGTLEYLVTSLFNQKKFPIKTLKELYHKRWGVEEQYKDIKHALAIENFSGKKVNSIKQEFYASIVTYNLTMMTLKKPVEKQANIGVKKHHYNANKRSLLAKFKQCFLILFFDLKKLSQTIKEIIKTVAKEAVAHKPDRKYKRGKTQKVKKKFHRAYIPVT